MKRFLFLFMVIIAALVVIVGIIEAQPWHGETPGAHVGMAMVFILLIVIHIIVQRKAVWRYLTGSVKLPNDPRQKMRQIMRRIIVYIILVFGLLTIISGVLSVHTAGRSVFHIVSASLFVLFFIRHLLANRKAIRNYFTAVKKEAATLVPDIEDSAD
jgi:p-aminobenzoyl-glutamate transporter AbgT